MLSASRVKVWIHFIWQGRQKRTRWNVSTFEIEAWTVDDWTRDTTIHLNHRDLMSYASFNNNNSKKKKSHIEMIECGVWSGFTVCKNSLAIFLGITKSHSRMYLKWTSQNLTSFALSLSLSLWKALSLYPHINMTRLLSSYKLFALTSLEKWYRTGGNRTRFDPHLTWNTCICCGHSLLPLLQDWQLQVSGGKGFSVLVKRLFSKLNWRDS